MAVSRLHRWLSPPVRFCVRRQRDRFLRATRDCQGHQRRVLRRLLSLNANTQFAQDHGLRPATTLDELRRRVPVSDYEYHRPYIEQVKAGNHRALLGRRNRLLMFSLTSGTTSDSKFIPVTNRFLADYRRGWQHWGITALSDHPDLARRRFFQLCGDHEQFRTEGGTPCGNISGLVAAMQKRHVRSMYAIPPEVHRIRDPRIRRYVCLRIALAEPDVGQLVTANPSTLLQLAEFANAESQRLISDIHSGGLSGEFEPEPKILAALEPQLVPQPRRAGELECLIEAADGVLRPADVWQHLALLGVWTGGSAGAFLRSLPQWYGNVPCRDHGLHASEGRMTIPLKDGTASGVLDVATHVFEFIPESEADAANPVVLQPHELEVGSDYFILLTTSSGLYRYNIRDVVRCTGFYHSTPKLTFLHKGSHISSITGEKISESQVVKATTKACRRLGMDLRVFTLTPCWDHPPFYRLYTHAADITEQCRLRLSTAVDDCLMRTNPEYEDKRRSGRLGAIQCELLPESVWNQFTTSRLSVRPNASLEQYKHPCLLPDPQFQSLFATAAGLRWPGPTRASA